MGYTLQWEPLHWTDFTYKGILSVLPTILEGPYRLNTWGFSIGPDENNCTPFLRSGEGYCWDKTNRLPYTKDVMRALILMVEHGVTSGLNHDDADMTWYLEALEAVHAVRPLATYEQQKEYFLTLNAQE
jgi:hypothetical protein